VVGATSSECFCSSRLRLHAPMRNATSRTSKESTSPARLAIMRCLFRRMRYVERLDDVYRLNLRLPGPYVRLRHVYRNELFTQRIACSAAAGETDIRLGPALLCDVQSGCLENYLTDRALK